MSSKFIQSNITILNRLKQSKITDATTKATQKRLDEIIKLYTERKISNVATAENLIKGLTSTNKKTYDKAFQKYKENIQKFKETKPLKERMAESKKKKEKKTYFVDFVLYTYYNGNLKESGIKTKPAFRHQGIYYFTISFDEKNATIKTTEFPKELIGQRIFRWPNIEDFENPAKENPDFWKAINLLKDDEDFKDTVETLQAYYDNLGCIKIKSVELVNEKGEKFDIMNENLTDAVNVSIYHDYIHTPIRMEAETIKQAIKKGNYINNLCWVNALNDFYGDTLMSEKTRKRLTRERIIEIIGKSDFNEKGASITDMEKVFKEYNIQVRIFNFCNQLVYKHDPEKRNHHIKTFYAMVKNSHIYVLNHDLKSIQQKQMCDIPLVKASTDYYINEKDEPPTYRMIKTIDDILILKEEAEKDEKKEMFLVMEDNNLTKALFELVRSGYEPKIKHQAGTITEIRTKFDKTKYIIRTQNLLKTSCDGCITVDNENTYNRMNLAMFNFYKALFIPSQKSFYNDIDIKILDETRTIVPCGWFYSGDCLEYIKRKISNKSLQVAEIDISKAFTSMFLKMDEKPVFNQFDIWKPYDGKIHEYHDLTLYYVQNNDFEKNKIFMNKTYETKYGFILKEVIDDVDIDILCFKTPSQIHKCNHKEIIDELWNMSISDDIEEDKYIKKLIANVNFGLLEKGGATDQKSLLFKSLSEAIDYQVNYGGKLHKVSDVEIEDEIIENEDELQHTSNQTNTDNYYILNIKDQAQLKNGFRYVKELLLQLHNLQMYKSYNKLKQNKIKMFSVKTDAFVIRETDVEKAGELLNFNNEIGGWRVSKYNEDIKFPTVKYEVVENELVEIQIYENKTIDIEDEYDTDNIIEYIKCNNPMMIRGELPGTGKSYICQRMVDKEYKVMFVCPTNKLLQAFEGEALTLNKFFGISFGDVRLEPFDYSGYDVIVFDEVYFSSLSTYWRIKQFVEQNKHDKIIIATGDTKQLKPIQPLTNIQDYETYADQIIDNIFQNNILLKICKRLETQEDKDKLNNIKEDIFINNITYKKFISKYFQYTTDISGSKNNIAYLNDTCKNVSSAIRKLENRTYEYEVGEFLICREYTKSKNSVFNVNFKYEIELVNSKFLKLKNVKSGLVQPLDIEKVRKNFIFAHCATCHSAQGSSIDGDITIFDYNHWDIREYKEWIWTAITRARDLNKVKFFKYSNDVYDEFNYKCMVSYYERKIVNYKEQDRRAKRKIPKEGYVNVEWFLDNTKNQCNYCGCGFYTTMNNGNITTNLTAQRVNNEYTHTLDNIVPYCKRCNCSCK